jgi:hypothetical protein
VKKHLHQQIGDAIHANKKRLFEALKLGADLELAIRNFICDLKRELEEIVKGGER